jgi:hypothetical protein
MFNTRKDIVQKENIFSCRTFPNLIGYGSKSAHILTAYQKNLPMWVRMAQEFERKGLWD